MHSQAIQHNRIMITDADRAAVDKVLTSGWISKGEEVKGLEADFNEYLGGGVACAVSSGSAALFLALRGLDIGRGDRVGVPTYSCSALLNAVYMAGAEPWVFDVRADNFTINVDRLDFDAHGVRTCIAVHCFGATADIGDLKKKNFSVVEDCCQSLGGPQGCMGDVSVFSFYATKVITGGQGGLLWDREGDITRTAIDYREFDGRKTYNQRFNFQMTDINATLVRSQFRRLESIRKRRRQIWAAYIDALPERLGTQSGLDEDRNLPYRFVIRTEDGNDRKALSSHLAQRGVSTIVPVERFELLHRYLELDPQKFPNAEALADTTLSLPLYPGLKDLEVNRIVDGLKAYK